MQSTPSSIRQSVIRDCPATSAGTSCDDFPSIWHTEQIPTQSWFSRSPMADESPATGAGDKEDIISSLMAPENEEWRLEYGRPSGEPRHPSLESGETWPPPEPVIEH